MSLSFNLSSHTFQLTDNEKNLSQKKKNKKQKKNKNILAQWIILEKDADRKRRHKPTFVWTPNQLVSRFWR